MSLSPYSSAVDLFWVFFASLLAKSHLQTATTCIDPFHPIAYIARMFSRDLVLPLLDFQHIFVSFRTISCQASWHNRKYITYLQALRNERRYQAKFDVFLNCLLTKLPYDHGASISSGLRPLFSERRHRNADKDNLECPYSALWLGARATVVISFYRPFFGADSSFRVDECLTILLRQYDSAKHHNNRLPQH